MSDDGNIDGARGRNDALKAASLSLPGIGVVRLLWSPKGLVSLSLPSQRESEVIEDMVDRGLPLAAAAELPAQFEDVLLSYASGDPVDPTTLPVDLRGTPFQVRVWQALRRVPRGEVRTYGGIATDVGSPRAMRAVGMANSANPIAIVVPCHRVVAAASWLGGYTGGLPMKRHLLGLEGVRVDGDKVLGGQLELFEGARDREGA